MRKYHFISGLPRSGSTLLSTILNQNPKFQANISSPMMRFTRSIIDENFAQAGYSTICNSADRQRIIRGIFDSFYNDQSKEVVFDTNRIWTSNTRKIVRLFGDAKVLVCVRDIKDILNSFEHLFQNNPIDTNPLIPGEHAATVYQRCDYLMHQQHHIGAAYVSLKEMLTNTSKSMYKIIEYNDLVSNPADTIKSVYEFIGEVPFPHNYSNLTSDYSAYDTAIGIPDMHKVRTVVEIDKKENLIPEEVYSVYSNLEKVWRK